MGPKRFHWSFWSRVIECNIRGATLYGRKVDDLEANLEFQKSLKTLNESSTIGFTALGKLLDI